MITKKHANKNVIIMLTCRLVIVMLPHRSVTLMLLCRNEKGTLLYRSAIISHPSGSVINMISYKSVKVSFHLKV